MLDLTYVVGYFLLLGGGGIISIYLYRSKIRAGSRLLGVSSIVLGVVGLVSSLFGIGAIVYYAIWLTFGLALLGVFYLETKRPVALVLLAIPFYVLALTFVLSLPFIFLFATFTLEVGILDASRLSERDLSSLAEGRTGDSSAKFATLPFRATLSLVRWLFRRPLTKGTVFFSYSLLPITLVIFAFMIWLFVEPIGVVYGTVIAIGAFFLIASYALNINPR